MALLQTFPPKPLHLLYTTFFTLYDSDSESLDSIMDSDGTPTIPDSVIDPSLLDASNIFEELNKAAPAIAPPATEPAPTASKPILMAGSEPWERRFDNDVTFARFYVPPAGVGSRLSRYKLLMKNILMPAEEHGSGKEYVSAINKYLRTSANSRVLFNDVTLQGTNWQKTEKMTKFPFLLAHHKYCFEVVDTLPDTGNGSGSGDGTNTDPNVQPSNTQSTAVKHPVPSTPGATQKPLAVPATFKRTKTKDSELDSFATSELENTTHFLTTQLNLVTSRLAEVIPLPPP